MNKWIGFTLLRLFGWKLEGEYPGPFHKNLIFIVMPHTSNWDFPLGISTKWCLPMQINWLGKHTLFKWPWGWIFRALGGVPVIRTANQNYVESIAATFKREDKMHLVIAPEGTRRKVDKLKSGFYHIARLANVPLAFIKINFKKRILYFSDVYHLTGNMESDMAYIKDYFKDGYGKRPELGYLWDEKLHGD
ncbi:MAG: 1-acyl-sn-glycerol-3-phosphate acyltransferase [Bacteroidia bacterium]|nr:1-acyl-sn-glycerol-3-phosphate acyltransferase [Bacteroidia bacterium]